MTPTIIIPCFADIADADKSQWQCETHPGLPEGLKELQAFGENFFEARKNLAELVALSISKGLVTQLEGTEQPAKIILMVTTRKTFDLQELLDSAAS